MGSVDAEMTAGRRGAEPLARALADISRTLGLPPDRPAWTLRLASGWLLATQRPAPAAGDLDAAAAFALVSIAAHAGLRLRPLHPPEAAVGLAGNPEFELHFHDSYAPLIRNAIRAGQQVLAWRREDTRGAWRILTALRGDAILGRRFATTESPAAGDTAQELSDPAQLAFVVEGPDPTVAAGATTADDLAIGWRRLAEQDHPGVAVGLAALETWRERLDASAAAALARQVAERRRAFGAALAADGVPADRRSDRHVARWRDLSLATPADADFDRLAADTSALVALLGACPAEARR